MINLKFVELHTPYFLAGTNLGSKLDITKKPDLFLQHDVKKGRIVVWYKDQMGYFSDVNAGNIVPIDIQDSGYEKPSIKVVQKKPQEAAQPNLNIKAQVSTPHDHVFSTGPGLTKM